MASPVSAQTTQWYVLGTAFVITLFGAAGAAGCARTQLALTLKADFSAFPPAAAFWPFSAAAASPTSVISVMIAGCAAAARREAAPSSGCILEVSPAGARVAGEWAGHNLEPQTALLRLLGV